ncbi:hypothetical protein FSARC_4831 [Fusarium sarcochroum]|uniref:NACHT domain-containing protein n=1 Tax=Fusarium sarcochroum TaxID=1208366 RepID=A0A8H4XB27_9HYPO|nr:hypothetical protein FSARC_4831 [Fusarium sarcochroum]
MAELAALGAAASVLQVIDFGTRFIVTAWQISRSDNSSSSLQFFSSSLQGLQDASTNLRGVQHELQTTPAHAGPDTAIVSLAEKTAVLSKEMLDSLERIGRDDQGRKRDALKKTWLMLWKEDKLKGLETKLIDVKADLAFFLTVNLRATARATLENQEQMLSEIRIMRADLKDLGGTSTSPHGMQQGFGASALEYLTSGLHTRQQIKAELEGAIWADIYKSEGQAGLPDSSSIQLPQYRRERLENIFVQRIRYDNMQERELTIKDAHEGTFRWIFESNGDASTLPIGFKEWLESDDGIYWITGKPGSGKSTLMRYILQPTSQAVGQDDETNAAMPHDKCEKHLRRWAGSEQKLTIASFHFWAIGSKLQASQEGLFRTLLFQLLRAHPEVIPMVSLSRWEALCLLNEDPKGFSQDELGDMFRQAVAHISTRTNLALFIDGLDEFDGDCGALITLVKKLVTSSIKICVSSRPWTEFEDAFAHCPRLRMEDLTYHDIMNYVVDKFEEDPQFKRLQRRQTEVANNLIQSIAEKASGVFLWVTIVVASLLAGMGKGDRVEDLEMRLDQLPAEIEKLYERIHESIDPMYLEHAAQLFELMNVFAEPPPLMLLWYADEVRFMDRVVNENPKTVSHEEKLERLEDMRRRINSRCKGLLEVQLVTTSAKPDIEFGLHVWYLHKTVFEFIGSHSARQKLWGHPKAPFDAHLRISAACAAWAKIRMQSMAVSEPSNIQFHSYVSKCLQYAAGTGEGSSSEVVRLLDNLRDECGSDYNPVQFSEPDVLYQSTADKIWMNDYSRLPDGSESFSIDQKFLCLATESMVLEYVRAKAKPGGLVMANCAQNSPYRKGIFSSISRKLLKRQEVPAISLLSLVPLMYPNSAPIIKLLLENGADPNTEIDRYVGNYVDRASPWEEVLANALVALEDEPDAELIDHVSKCVRLMIDWGAKVSSKTVERALGLQGEDPSRRRDNRGRRRAFEEKQVLQCLKRMKKDRDAKFTV